MEKAKEKKWSHVCRYNGGGNSKINQTKTRTQTNKTRSDTYTIIIYI